MTGDIPPDVEAVLRQLFSEGQRALENGEVTTARSVVASARTVASNKLPDGDRRDRLRHGCDRVASLLGPEDSPDAEAASEYLAAMERRLDATGD